jgi:hypothetical protein
MDLLDFNTQREAWIYYTLSDASRFKFKLVLTQVVKSRSQVNDVGQPIYYSRAQSLFALVSFSEALRKPPSTGNITKKRLSKSAEQQVTFNLESGQDVWNIYRLEDGTVLRIMPIVENVVRTKLRGGAGEPIYVIGSKQDSRWEVPNNLVKKR